MRIQLDFNGYNLEVGPYWYKMPHWDSPILIAVEKDQDGDLAVRFQIDQKPVKVQDLPAASILLHGKFSHE